MKFTLEIELGNDAMQNPGEVADTLDTIAKQLRESGLADLPGRSISDINGNTVGRWEVTA